MKDDQKKAPYFASLMKKDAKKKDYKEEKQKKERTRKPPKYVKKEEKPKQDEHKKELKKAVKPENKTEETRLNVYIAKSGVCSRRQADELIKGGKIKLNGEIVAEMGKMVKPGDKVEYNGKLLKAEKMVYILINKPKDTITSNVDPDGRRTVFDLIKGATEERIYSVGRLDRNTTGVLLLTNDGDLTEQLTHPKYKKRKIYEVHLNKNLSLPDFEKILEGVEIEDEGKVVADELSFVDAKDKSIIGIEIHSGQNRVVRRIFEALGYEIEKLDRVYFAGLTKKDLPRGKWRFLSDKEVAFLKMKRFD
jgi:23S rRNA pseudouridine2605 synthase